MPTARVNGIDLHYELDGPERAPLVVFSNSLGATARMWDGVVARLSNRFRCLRYDTRGHGRSGSSDAEISIDDLAADLKGLLDAVGAARAHVVGLSLGGMTAQAFALNNPGAVASLTLIATAAHLPTRDFWNQRAALVRREGMASVVDILVPRWFTEPFRAQATAAVEQTRSDLLASEPRGYARCCEAIGAMDLRPRISGIAAPTLAIAGAQDPVTTPAMLEEIRALIPGAELTVLPGAAHLVSVERPDALAAHIGLFLDTIESRPAAGGAFTAGLANRRKVLGTEHVDRSLAGAGPIGMPWQDFITRYAWNEIWGDPTLPHKTRSLVTLAMMIALGREEEFKLHVRPALGNGVTVEELAALIRQAAVYGGVPAGNGAMRWAREVLGDAFK
jgi:3-oxoadipate enol-lactonase/4-carboxymuconolactone decarboxylase